MNKKSALIALLVVITISVIGISAYFMKGKEGEQKKVESVLPEIPLKVEDITASWKTYRNEKYGFEVKYPSNLVEIVEIENYTISKPDGSEVTYPIIINFLREGAPTAGDFATLAFLDYKENLESIMVKNTFLGESPQHPESIEEFNLTQLGGNQIYFLNNYLFEGEYRVIYFIPSKDRVAMIELISHTEGDWTDPNWKLEIQPFYQLMNQILSTWHYIQ